MKKMLFVFNPNSGKAQIKNVLMSIIQTFSNAGYQVTVYPTKASKDAYNHIKDSEGLYDIVVCSGGDGTLNETVGAVLGYTGKKPPIGYIPSGTTNDFAVSLSIPKDMHTAAMHIAYGKPRKCDIGIFNDRSFNYVAAFGAFTAVSYDTPQQMKNILGHQAYLWEGVKSLSSIKSYHMKMSGEDGVVIEDEFIYGMISNTKSVGGMKGLTGKNVDLNDGMFEVTMIRNPKNPLELQPIFNAFLTQKADGNPMIISFKTSRLTFESDTFVPWTLDGEYGGEHSKIHVEVIQDAVEFIIKKRNE